MDFIFLEIIFYACSRGAMIDPDKSAVVIGVPPTAVFVAIFHVSSYS